MEHAADSVHDSAVEPLSDTILAGCVGSSDLPSDAVLTKEVIGGSVDKLTTIVCAKGSQALACDILCPRFVVREVSQHIRSALALHEVHNSFAAEVVNECEEAGPAAMSIHVDWAPHV